MSLVDQVLALEICKDLALKGLGTSDQGKLSDDEPQLEQASSFAIDFERRSTSCHLKPAGASCLRSSTLRLMSRSSNVSGLDECLVLLEFMNGLLLCLMRLDFDHKVETSDERVNHLFRECISLFASDEGSTGLVVMPRLHAVTAQTIRVQADV